MTYRDFTTGMKYIVDDETWNRSQRMYDEEGFQRVMKLQPSEKAGGSDEA